MPPTDRRRRIQLEAARNLPIAVATMRILQEDGIGGMYRGFIPNTLKNLPNKGGCEGRRRKGGPR
jgi:solute carrier family 25 phosphate transporter 23/24/25/41